MVSVEFHNGNSEKSFLELHKIMYYLMWPNKKKLSKKYYLDFQNNVIYLSNRINSLPKTTFVLFSILLELVLQRLPLKLIFVFFCDYYFVTAIQVLLEISWLCIKENGSSINYDDFMMQL